MPEHMLIFHDKEKYYRGDSACDIVRMLESDEAEYPYRGRSIRRFLNWSLDRLTDKLPSRDLYLSDHLEDDELALSYLCLRTEFGAGALIAEGSGRAGNRTHE